MVTFRYNVIIERSVYRQRLNDLARIQSKQRQEEVFRRRPMFRFSSVMLLLLILLLFICSCVTDFGANGNTANLYLLSV